MNLRTYTFVTVMSMAVAFAVSCKNEEKPQEVKQIDENTTIVPAPDELDISKVAFLEAEEFANESKRGGAVLVDVRLPGEFDQGHIEGATNINFFDPMFKSQLLDLDKDKKYYLYCKNETRSRMAAAFMNYNDFPDVYVLRGGYEGWKQKGMN
jgi:rhodanese-related sulfurtransferase